MIRRAKRFDAVRGFGIDRVAAAADRPAQANPDWPVLRMENLDTDLPLPPEAVRATVEGLEQPEANSWLPFTGDHALRAAIADFTAERTGHRYDPETEIVITVGRDGGSAERAPRHGRRRRRDRRDRSDLRGHRQSHPPRRRDSDVRAVPSRGRGVAARPRRARGGRGDRSWDAPDEPVDALRRDVRRGGLAPRLRPLPRARPLPDLRRGHGTAAVRRATARPSAPLRGDGGAHARRRLALEGAPHDRLARRLGGRPRRDDRGRRLGARLQHDDAGRDRAARRDRGACAATRITWPSASPSSSAGATSCSKPSPAGPWSSPAAAGHSCSTSPSSAWSRRTPPADCSRRRPSRRPGMRGWGADVAERHVRFVYSAEPLERLRGIPKRLEKSSLRR